jgi:diadenylate cyclase
VTILSAIELKIFNKMGVNLLRQKREDKITEILRKIAPGTPIRNGLENILKARTGALLFFTDSEDIIKQIVDGGFYINEEYTSSKLYELAKMDGAIVLSGDMKKIQFANAELIPDSAILTVETGTRHRTAERTAKQTGELVISISQRRNIITIFKDNERYILEDTDAVLNKANQAIQTLEKYKKVFDSKLNILNEYEFNDIVTLENVLTVIQRAEMVMQIVQEIEKQIAELGVDGRLVSMQLNELIGGIENEEELIIKDYSIAQNKTSEEIIEEISSLSYEELLKEQNIAKILGYDNFSDYEEFVVSTKGYRILNKIPRMPNNIVENLIQGFESFQHIVDASIEDLDNIEGIGEVRARNIKTALKRMQEQFVFDNIIN